MTVLVSILRAGRSVLRTPSVQRGGWPFALALTSALIGVMTSACGGGSSIARGAAEGQDLFARQCAVCHGPDGTGKQIGTMQVPSLKRDDAVNATDERLFQIIAGGGIRMPPFRQTLTEAQIRSLVRYIRQDIQSRK
jgi:mono/diheme cytochrome c family protein